MQEELEFVEAVVKPPADPFTTAIELITEKRHAVSYKDEKKWLHFTGDANFVRALFSKMRAAHRRQYGQSTQFGAKLIEHGDTTSLYVNSQSY